MVAVQCDQIWQNFAHLIKILKVFGNFKALFNIYQNLESTLAHFYDIGQIMIVTKGQKLKT